MALVVGGSVICQSILSSVVLGILGTLLSSAIAAPALETTTSSSGYSQSCDGLGEIYDIKTKKCYPLGKRGPCGNYAMFGRSFKDVNDTKGTGTCMCDDIGIDVSKCAVRPVVLWSENSECYPLFDQGPCAKGEWLVANANTRDSATCVPNPCLQQMAQGIGNTNDKRSFVFHHSDGKCHKTGSQAFCKKGEVALFHGFPPSASCYSEESGACSMSPSVFESPTGKVAPIPCSDKQTSTADGNCEAISKLEQ